MSRVGEVHVVESLEELLALVALRLTPPLSESRGSQGSERKKSGGGEHIAGRAQRRKDRESERPQKALAGEEFTGGATWPPPIYMIGICA